MTMMVFIWGFHFVIMKDALGDVSVSTFQALRFSIGAPVLALLVIRDRSLLVLHRDEILPVFVTTLIGPVAYQVMFAAGLDRTTATNSALILATMPTWTAIFSLIIGFAELRRILLGGIVATLIGVVLVVLSRGGSNLSLAHDDLIGSGLLLMAAMTLGASNIYRKPIVDKLGSLRAAIWTYYINMIALVLIAAPELLRLTTDDMPLSSLPNVAYSGILSGAGGFVFNNYALSKLGPTRTSSYFNFNPIVAAFAGIVIASEPFSVGLLIGGALTLGGVMVVRQNMYRKAGAPALEPERKHQVPT